MSFDPWAAFFDGLRGPLFGGGMTASQVEGVEAITREGRRRGLPLPQIAYVLATAHHETGRRMQPVREGFARDDAHAVRIVTAMHRAGRIRVNYAKPDRKTGRSYYGRGHVQLTWRRNYATFAKRLGVDLVGDPDLALDPVVSVAILFDGMSLGLYTGKRLADYITPQSVDFVGARRIVNGTDKAELVAGYARSYLEPLRAAVRAQEAAVSASAATHAAGNSESGSSGRSGALEARVAELEAFKNRIVEAVAAA